MKTYNYIAAVLSSMAAISGATVVGFYPDRGATGLPGCSLFIDSLDLPSEIGCTTIPNGYTALSFKVPGFMPTDCVIELYSDASCNTLEVILDWGVDEHEYCSVANSNVVAYDALCGLGDGKRSKE